MFVCKVCERPPAGEMRQCACESLVRVWLARSLVPLKIILFVSSVSRKVDFVPFYPTDGLASGRPLRDVGDEI